MAWLENTHEMIMLQSWPEVFVDRSSCWRQVFLLNSKRLSQYFHGSSLTLTLTLQVTDEQICWHKTCWGCRHEFAFFLPRLKWRSKSWKLLEIFKIIVEILKLLNFYKIPLIAKDALVVWKISVFQWSWARRRQIFPQQINKSYLLICCKNVCVLPGQVSLIMWVRG